MRAYDIWIEDSNTTVVIFARGIDRAADLFCEWHDASFGDMPGSFTVAHRTLHAELEAGALRNGLLLGKEGLGTKVDGKWSIAPIECEDAISSP